MIPKKPFFLSINAPVGVYLTTYQFDWMDWVCTKLPKGYEPGLFLKVNVENLKLKEDKNETVTEVSYGNSYYTTEKIPPERIVSLSVATAKNPHSFEECEIIFLRRNRG